MGMPKTGSTSLQKGLGMIRERLLEEGFCYPESVNEHDTDFHHILLAFYNDIKALEPYQLRRFGSLENLVSEARNFLSDAAAVASQRGCHTIILSSELVFPNDRRDLRKLVPVLNELSRDIEPVIYVREVAGQYKSQMQQGAKAFKFHKPDGRASLRSQITTVEAALGRKATVRPFAADQLVSGDIVADFCSEVLGLDGFADDVPTVRLNPSLSAEVTYALLYYGRLLAELGFEFPYRGPFEGRKRLLRFSDQDGKLTELKLKDDLVAALRHSAIDYLWLRDRYGITFREMDYDRIGAEAEMRLSRFQTPEDVFEVDRDKVVWLLLRLIHDRG